jgi:hypothetical protein
VWPRNQTSCRKNVRSIGIFHPIDELEDADVIQGNPQEKANDPIERRGGVMLDDPGKEGNGQWQKQHDGGQHARVIQRLAFDVEKKGMGDKVAYGNYEKACYLFASII